MLLDLATILNLSGVSVYDKMAYKIQLVNDSDKKLVNVTKFSIDKQSS